MFQTGHADGWADGRVYHARALGMAGSLEVPKGICSTFRVPKEMNGTAVFLCVFV